ncbi:MAG: DUF4124 domain-containing protein [Burkholderiales bacterium]|nr:DUF4124 domain-containing protein [Burkholderiales bacterium]
MKTILALAFALVAPFAANAQLYKWVDKDGRVTYSDQPPPSQQSKQINVPAGVGAPAPKSAVERDKELEKSRADARDKAKVAAERERKAEFDQENCNRARAYLRTLEAGGRIATTDAKGEAALLDDAQIEAERAKAATMAEEACKPS